MDSANLLAQQTSPYLLQHADNPVHWRAWGADALAEAQAADKPILLSIGYAACHWCHVMAHESFEDPATAERMNALFVNIKVDREERPDIDHLYMSALHALGEQGGWPLTMFLTPRGDPFWGGTYFPPEPRWGRPSFGHVLETVARAYREGHDMVRSNSAGLHMALARMSDVRPGDGIGPAQLDRAAASLLGVTDPEQGGLRGAPKFPNPPLFRFLWQNARRTGYPAALDTTHLLLVRMSQGGIYDHLGGGYARYSTDAVWLAPHFEKMLYDNAQILELLALAHADRPDPLYAERAEETVDWLLRDMTAERIGDYAAFAASEDADSEGVEGKYYVWSEAEIDALLGPDAMGFKSAYDVTPDGNWEHSTILRRVAPRGTAVEEAALARCRATLLQARGHRIRPGRDDKVLADWNALMVAALCRASAVFDRPAWLARASDAFDFVWDNMTQARGSNSDRRVTHAFRLGRPAAAGLLDDQAALVRAALALFEATAEPHRLEQAIALAKAAVGAFGDEAGAYYVTAVDANDVPLGADVRPRTASDNAVPSGAGLLAEVFARLHHLTGDAEWRRATEALLRAYAGSGDRLSSMPTLLAAADLLEEATLVVLVGETALRQTALAGPDPAVVVLSVPDAAALPTTHPAHGKRPGAAYVCRRNVCGLPITDAAVLAATLRSRR